jgi:hypothetical protein
LAEPPSVAGTGSGQAGEGELGAVAVVLADCVDVSGISPGNNRGDWDVPDAADWEFAPVAPLADPVVVADPDDVPNCDNVPNCDTGEGDGADDKEGVGTLNVGALGADPPVLPLLLVWTVLPLLFVWPFGCNMVWPWAVVTPRNMIEMMKTNFIALSCV